ncbi:MAG: peptidyl-tRNA hydrolase Pth2 [Candidatus Micrarchaeia archaeon]|jgi:PTH2 family peptidyl-tRNA hydrolase
MVFFKNNSNFSIKQVIVIRNDIKLGKGKLAGQVAHASVAGYRNVKQNTPQIIDKWEMEGEKKVVVKVEGEKELMDLFQRIKDKKIPVALIRDAGLTQITPGTKTCFAIGPWYENEIDEFTRDLKLL